MIPSKIYLSFSSKPIIITNHLLWIYDENVLNQLIMYYETALAKGQFECSSGKISLT